MDTYFHEILEFHKTRQKLLQETREIIIKSLRVFETPDLAPTIEADLDVKTTSNEECLNEENQEVTGFVNAEGQVREASEKLESGEDCRDVKENEDHEIECKSILKEASAIKYQNYGQSRTPSPSQHIHGGEKYEEIPKGFFCPNSNRFMADLITIPASDFIYDQDFVKELHHPEDVQSDLIMRKEMEGIHCEAEVIIVEDTLSLVPKNRSATKEIIKTDNDLEWKGTPNILLTRAPNHRTLSETQNIQLFKPPLTT
jgi:hypothetical protein